MKPTERRLNLRRSRAAHSAKDLLFVGTHGHVTAVGKKHGRRAWSTSLPSTGFDIVSLLVEDEIVFAASKGFLFALDAGTGEILWKNGLRGLGHGYALLATAETSKGDAVVMRAAKVSRDTSGSGTF